MMHSGKWQLERLSARAALVAALVGALSGAAHAGPQQPQPPPGAWVIQLDVRISRIQRTDRFPLSAPEL